MLPESGRLYLLAALDNTPATLAALLSGFPADDPIWKTQPDPERFSLREIVAHLADWESVFGERFERTVSEDHPKLRRPNPGERAVDQGYADADPVERLTHLQASRTARTAWLRSLPEDAWGRAIDLDQMVDISLTGLVSLMLGHDAYHIRQVSEWLAAAVHQRHGDA